MRYFFYIWMLAEIAVFIMVGSWIGIGWTILLVILSAVAGFAILRSQSFTMMRKMQAAMNSGQQPDLNGVDMTFTMLAGIFLIIPGFITSVLAILFLIPGVRNSFSPGFKRAGMNVHEKQPSDPNAIEGEFWEDKPDQNTVNHDRDEKK